MDLRLQSLKRSALAGDKIAETQLLVELSRAGYIPFQYIMILSMMKDPAALPIMQYDLPKGKGYLTHALELLDQPGVEKKDGYDFFLYVLDDLIDLWRMHYPEYDKYYGEITQGYLNYFKNLGPLNPPDRESLLSIIREIGQSFDQRVQLRDNPGCDVLGELELLEMAFRFLMPIDDLNALILGEELGTSEYIPENIHLTQHYNVADPDASFTGWFGNVLLEFGGGYCDLNFHKFLYISWQQYFQNCFKNFQNSFRLIPRDLGTISKKAANALGKKFIATLIKGFIHDKIYAVLC